jgi:hypothetical protein
LTDRVRLPARYRLVGFIAGGGMAGVWEAEDTKLGRRVAVKVLAEHLAEDPVNARRFEREARAAARVSSHPHVVTIYDVGEHDGRSFIVMERLTGGTVANALHEGRVPRERALTWLGDAAAAIDAAHEQGIIHRDVKPGNLLRDEHERVRVADFGIARLASEATVTQTGQLLGTAAYLSPEQVLGHPTTPASDRYALAVVAYELLTGRRPFTATHPTAQARQHIEDDVEPASEVDRSLPRAVDAVLARGMDKDPERRWPTASAFVAALESALAAPQTAPTARLVGERTAPTALLVPASVRRPRRPWPALVALAGVVAAVALVIGLSSGGGGGTTPTRHTVAAAPKHRAQPKKQQPKATATTTPAAPSVPTDVASLNTRQVQAYNMINGGQAATGLGIDRAILATLGTQGYDAGRCQHPASDQACMVFAHALFDVGHALRVLGQAAAAIPFLQQRLTIDDQRAVVAAELAQAQSALGGGSPSGGAAPPGKKPGKGPKPGHG